jgi:hypothetical protein
MKNRSLMQFFAVCVGLILLSAILPVNSSSLLHLRHDSTLIADGIPLPPPEPRHFNSLPDGIPLPPPEPRHINNLIDGIPLPPPEPRHIHNLIDGIPLAPPEPRHIVPVLS